MKFDNIFKTYFLRLWRLLRLSLRRQLLNPSNVKQNGNCPRHHRQAELPVTPVTGAGADQDQRSGSSRSWLIPETSTSQLTRMTILEVYFTFNLKKPNQTMNRKRVTNLLSFETSLLIYFSECQKLLQFPFL